MKRTAWLGRKMHTIIDLIRHGEPEGGVKFRGNLDDPLSVQGFAQMWEAIGEVRPWKHIVASPLKRCAQFAAALSARTGIPMTTDDRLKEMSFGEWEGKTPEQLYSIDPNAVRCFHDNPLVYPPPGGEKLESFSERVEAAWHDLIAREKGNHVLVVSHGAVIRVLLAHVLDMPLHRLFCLEVGYAAVSRLRVSSDSASAKVVFHDGRLDRQDGKAQ